MGDVIFLQGSIIVNYTLKVAENQSVEDLVSAIVETFENDTSFVVDEKSVILESSRYSINLFFIKSWNIWIQSEVINDEL